MAGEALSRAGDHIDSFKLIPGPHGKFDVHIDGELVGEHRHEENAHLFPDIELLLKAIKERVGTAATT